MIRRIPCLWIWWRPSTWIIVMLLLCLGVVAWLYYDRLNGEQAAVQFLKERIHFLERENAELRAKKKRPELPNVEPPPVPERLPAVPPPPPKLEIRSAEPLRRN